MNNNTRILVEILSWTTAIAMAVVAAISYGYNLMNLVKIISTVVGAVDIIFILYTKLLWKWLNFFKIPKIAGKYEFTMEYTFEKKKGEKKGQAKITQDFFGAKISLKTDEIISDSIMANIDHDNNEPILYYVYRARTYNTETREKNPDKTGTAILMIEGNRLKGDYFTDRESIGKIIFEKMVDEKAGTIEG